MDLSETNYKIFNSNIGLSFCIQVGSNESESSDLSPEGAKLSISNDEICPEESSGILLEASDKVTDADIVKHEISEDVEKLDPLELDELDVDIQIPDIISSKEQAAKSNFSDDFEFLQFIHNLDSDIASSSAETLAKPHTKAKNTCSISSSPVRKCNGILVCNKQKKPIKKNLGMKLMKDSNGKIVMKSFYQCASKKGSYIVEPSMMSKPLILTKKVEEYSPLQSLNLTYNPSCGLSFKSKNVTNTPYKDIVRAPFPKPCLIKGNKDMNDEEFVLPANVSRVLHWEEGNIDQIEDYIGISNELKDNYFNSDFSSNILQNTMTDDSNTHITINDELDSNSNTLSKCHKILLSWEAVLKRIEELQGETYTKYLLDYISPSFKDSPAPFRRIHLSLNTKRRDVDISIPSNGVPFVLVGTCVYSCHLAKRKSKKNSPIKSNKTKKIGCPASIGIAKIARFPDFDITALNPICEKELMAELKDSWDFHSSKVRYYFEYHLKEPTIEDHMYHEYQLLQQNGTKFQEPIDYRVIEKTKELARIGYTNIASIQEEIRHFVSEELFKGIPSPQLDRRRFNPYPRDIRYILNKTKSEMKKEGKSITQIQCCNLTQDISELIRNISQEDYLSSIRSYLTSLYRTIKNREPIELLRSNVQVPQEPLIIRSQSSTQNRLKRKRLNPNSEALFLEKDACFNQIQVEPDKITEPSFINPELLMGTQFLADQEFADMTTKDIDALQVYYLPDGNYELANT